eukprot:scaffold594281_cov55-Attheya_sp.AAC.5
MLGGTRTQIDVAGIFQGMHASVGPAAELNILVIVRTNKLCQCGTKAPLHRPIASQVRSVGKDRIFGT